MPAEEDHSGDIYLLSLDTFMIMSVVGLSLGMIFFLLNPSFKEGEPPLKVKYILYEIPRKEFDQYIESIPYEYKINNRIWMVHNSLLN